MLKVSLGHIIFDVATLCQYHDPFLYTSPVSGAPAIRAWKCPAPATGGVGLEGFQGLNKYSTMYIRSRENKYFEILKYIEIFNYLSRYTSCTFKEFCPQITEISCSITHIRKYCERVLSVSCPEEGFFIQPAFTAEKDFTCSHYCIYRKMGQRPGRRANPSLGVIQKYEGERQECGSGSGGIRMIRIRIMNMWVRILESILFGCFCKLNLLKATTVKTIKAREKNI